MPLDPQLRVLLDAMAVADLPPVTGGDPVEARRLYREMALARRGAGYVPEAVDAVEDTVADGVLDRVYTPGGDTGASVVLFLHGGGFVIGDLDTHDPVCRRLANTVGAVVVSVDYRLAPEHPFPAPFDDAETVLRWAAARYPQRRIAAAGDSAGATLAAGLSLRARQADVPPLAAQLLWYPATDPMATTGSRQENGDGYFMTSADIAWFLEQFLPGGRDADAPEVDLLRSDVTGVAPAVVATAEFDPLRDEGDAFADHLRAAGVAVVHVPGPGLIHGYVGFVEMVDQADKIMHRTIEAFAEILHG
ncbi:alpha/beta hydrolase [Pseudonocardia ailaonensis]|uniref:Alpha/beta hydrolase n=1 Tax=Pseudonocardia ailaonensis TaxID=367279 RepID=A0ABN2N666_9PSEU